MVSKDRDEGYFEVILEILLSYILKSKIFKLFWIIHILSNSILRDSPYIEIYNFKKEIGI